MVFTNPPAPQWRNSLKRRLVKSAVAGILAVSAASAIASGRLSAQPLNPALIPAGTHWIIYINSDALAEHGHVRAIYQSPSPPRKKWYLGSYLQSAANRPPAKHGRQPEISARLSSW